VYYQQDKDWFYRAEERRWITLNDNSGWRRIERAGRASSAASCTWLDVGPFESDTQGHAGTGGSATAKND
jgi:hypothetical protein